MTKVMRPKVSASFGAVVVVALVAGSCSGRSTPAVRHLERVRGGRTGTYVVPEGIHKIKHVIVIQQENRSFDSYFGTFPGADGIPMKNGSPDRVRGRPGHGGLRGALCRPCRRERRRTPLGPQRHGRHRQREDGRLHRPSRSPGRKGCLDPTDPACTNSATPDVMGYHTESDIPNYWTYAKDFVLQDHMFEPNASWSLPSHLFLVSEWSAYCTEVDNPSSCVNALQTRPAERPPNAPAYYGGEAGPKTGGGNPKNGQQGQEGRPAHLRLDGSDLPAPQIPRELGVLRGERDRAGLPRTRRPRPVRRYGRTPTLPGIWNPLPWFDTVKADRSTGEHPVGRELLRGGEGRHPSGRVVGGAVGGGERASARPGELRAELCDQSDQRRHEEPRLGFDRHLSGLGRLGWLLRPRRPAHGGRERLRAPGAGHRHQPVRQERVHRPSDF